MPALAVMDAVARLIPGVLNNDESAGEESFENGLLEYPQYTRPEVFMEKKVPDVLISGHHENIEIWRLALSLIRTYDFRPDLLAGYKLTKENKKKLVKLLASDILNHEQALLLRDIINRIA